MKKKGFTLAEALVALAVVGVVAAMTVPQIAIGVQKKQAGAMLAKAYAQIEQGMQNYVQAYNDTSADGSFVEKWTDIPNKDIKVLMTYSGAKFVKELNSGDFMIKTRPGSGGSIGSGGDLYRFNKLPVEFEVSQFLWSYNIMVDVNGIENKPNTYGVDVFRFKLDPNGGFEPEGKEDWKEKCGDTISDGKACTARVMAEGWKITY